MFKSRTILLSIVMKMSKRSRARLSNSPFSIPAQPISGTDSTAWPGKWRSSRQSKFSSSRIFKSDRREHLLSKIVQQCDDLLAFHAGKPFQEFIDRFASFQMIEKTLDRHACANEDRFAPKNLGVRM